MARRPLEHVSLHTTPNNHLFFSQLILQGSVTLAFLIGRFNVNVSDMHNINIKHRTGGVIGD